MMLVIQFIAQLSFWDEVPQPQKRLSSHPLA